VRLFLYFATGDLIDPKDGSLVWYPRGPLKEGYQLAQGQRRKIERGMWLAVGLALVCVVLPVAWLRSHLAVLAGPTGALVVLITLGLTVLLVFLDLVHWRPRRIVKAAKKRDSDCRPKDVDRIHIQGPRPDVGPSFSFFLLILAAVLLGDFLKRITSDSALL